MTNEIDNNGQMWMVIYPNGDRTTLDVEMVWDYQTNQWDLASNQRFDKQETAQDYAAELAMEHGKKLGFKTSGILDEGDRPASSRTDTPPFHVWMCAKFDGSTGWETAAVIVSSDIETARQRLDAKLAEHSLPQSQPPELVWLPLDRPGAYLLADGSK